jgi:hypothetical protein
MNEGRDGFAPERGMHARLIEHKDDTFNHSIGPLYNTILLEPIPNSMLLCLWMS